MARRIWILALVLCALFTGLKAWRGGALETDLLAMLPPTERSPLPEKAIASLARAAGDRAVFLVGGPDAPGTREAALELAAGLRESGAFQGVLGRLPAMDPGAVPRFYGERRFRLPAPAAPLRDALEARLAVPMGSLPGLDPATDPVGHVQAFLGGLPLQTLRLANEDGLLLARDGDRVHVLVAATLPGSAYDPRVQDRAAAAVRGAEGRLRAAHPGLELLRTGAVFYGEEARTRAEGEATLITWASLGATVLLFVLVFGSARHLAVGLLCVGGGMAVAAAATLAAFGRMHLMTLVCGASMLGVAVDYPFLYFAHHVNAGPGWDARASLRALLPALLMGAATTMLGFATLGAAPFPGLRQMALFSVAGVAGSLATLALVAPSLLARPVPPRPALAGALGRALRAWRMPAWALGTLALLACAALPRLRVDDDVRTLVQSPGALRAQEERIREITGVGNQGRFLLVEGPDAGTILAREEALRARLAGLPGLEGVQAVSCFVPSPGAQARSLEDWRRRRTELEAALKEAGFRPEVVAAVGPGLEAAAGRPITVEDWMGTPLAGAFRHLWMPGEASLVLPQGPIPSARLRAAVQDLPGVRLVDKADSVSALLGRFRRLANAALAGALVLVGAMLAWRYGWKRGIRVLLPAVLGILAALAGCALLGLPLTLFSTIALVLVLGFGVDYTVFVAEASEPFGPAAMGTALAGFATLLSFGLLAFSRTPVLQGFGAALGVGVAAALLLAPLARKESA
ncbi:MAG TPA: MMPL family transporter [Holophaga sp.]|nr:MMPL family transporter [Holophaga sp.]